MIEKKIKITHPRGIHLKPATMIAQYCIQHQEVEVEIHKDGLTALGNSVMSILSLELNKGSTVTITVNQDQPEIIDHIADILNGKVH